VVHKYITLPLRFFGEFLVIDRILFLMTDKTQVNSVITPFSVMQKISENEKITKFSNSVGQMTEMSQREKTALGHEKIHRPLSECHVWTSGVTDGGARGVSRLLGKINLKTGPSSVDTLIFSIL